VKYDMTAPCPHCPFRNDRPGFITPARAREIAKAITIEQKTFACHQTTVAVEDDEGNCDMQETPDSQHCAGAMILLERLERPNQMMRIAERIGLYDMRKLDMSAPVVRSVREFVKLQEEKQRRKTSKSQG
jgi:hypothetical protein